MAELRRNDDEHRYELWEGDDRVGVAVFHDRGRRRVFVHTEIDDAHEGRGFGSDLVRGALDDTRGQDRPVVPLCPFVSGWIDRHEGYQDLVDEEMLRHLDA